MHRPGFILLVTLSLAACKTEPGDTDSGTDSGTTTGTTTGTTEPGTTEPGTGTTTGSGSATTGTTDAPTTGDDTTGPPGTTTGTTGPDTTGTTGPVDERCMMYCTDIMANCAGPVAQYPSLNSCMSVCDTFRPGNPGNVSGNSFACRRYHTDAAAMDADTHCVHAGPAGGGACGDNCEGFCTIATAICPGEHPDPPACAMECGGFPDVEKYDTSDVAGDTLACRLYHLVVAATDDVSAMTHCPHTVAASPTCM